MFKQDIIVILISITTFIQLSAQEWKCLHLGDISKSLNENSDITVQDLGSCDDADNLMILPRNVRVKNNPFRSEVKFKDVSLIQSGSLATVLGDEINDIDSLVVRGSINGADIYTMWSSSFYGRLTVINLEYATIQDNKLPNNAFWYQSEQYTFGSDYINCIPLRRIILPEGLQEIGESAFCYPINLVDIYFPSSLREIKKRSFSDCISLNVNPLIIPKGVEEIGYMAFCNCKTLTGRVVLPSTIRRINGGAFFQSKITECNFPDGLEEIGDAAFYATRLKEAILPNSCQSFPGSTHFMLNYELEKVQFPEGVTTIPDSFVENCLKLKEFIMPNSVEVIGHHAFWQCGALQELHLSSNLKSIETEGLYYCKGLKIINFPSTLETLGAESCEYWKRIEKIYCAAKIPPTCINSELNPGCTPFGEYDDDFVNRTPQDTPIYVPVGCADLYRNAWGWNYFTNFIEIDFSGIQDCLWEEDNSQKFIYDLQGRKVDSPIPNQLYIINGKISIVRLFP